MPAGPVLDSAGATRITLPKKRPAGSASHSNKISISTKLTGEASGASTDTQISTKPPTGEITENQLDGRPRKRRETAQDDEARQQLINKILNESSKKLKKKAEESQCDSKRELRLAIKPRPDPPCVKLISRPQGMHLAVPSAIDIHQLLNSHSPRPQRPTESCACGQTAKYRDPTSLRSYCSVPCFKQIKQASL